MSAFYFTQLRVSDDGNTLFINAEPTEEGNTYFQSPMITTVTVCTADQITESVSPSTYIYRNTVNTDNLSLALTAASFDAAFTNNSSTGATATAPFKRSEFSKTLFYVFLDLELNPVSECVPCGSDNTRIVGVTFDYNTVYENAMQFTKELADNCSVPRGFIDFILNFEALQAAINTGHYVPANQFYKKLTGYTGGISSISNGCGCHG